MRVTGEVPGSPRPGCKKGTASRERFFGGAKQPPPLPAWPSPPVASRRVGAHGFGVETPWGRCQGKGTGCWPPRAELSGHVCGALTAHRRRWPSIVPCISVWRDGASGNTVLCTPDRFWFGDPGRIPSLGGRALDCAAVSGRADVEQCPSISGIRAGSRSEPGEEIQRRLCRICSLRKRRARKGKASSCVIFCSALWKGNGKFLQGGLDSCELGAWDGDGDRETWRLRTGPFRCSRGAL